MLRRNFGRISGIIVDICSAHGTWFDVGEVPRTLSFIAQGGLRRAESLQAEDRRTHGTPHVGTIAPPGALEHASTEPPSWDDVSEAVRSFAHWVYQMLR
jgi:hypothetical protein